MWNLRKSLGISNIFNHFGGGSKLSNKSERSTELEVLGPEVKGDVDSEC